MPLEDYRKKRDFSRTPELQKHAASRLHYDFRLELNGVLPSWTTRSTTARSRAVIPEGEYGAGPVVLGDRGTWTPVLDPAKTLEKGRGGGASRGYGRLRRPRALWLAIRA